MIMILGWEMTFAAHAQNRDWEATMKKRNCRKTLLETQQHDTAVKVRKMTDAQICNFIEKITTKDEKADSVGRFFLRLDCLAGTGNGISTGTIFKLRKIAVKEGFLEDQYFRRSEEA